MSKLIMSQLIIVHEYNYYHMAKNGCYFFIEFLVEFFIFTYRLLKHVSSCY